jgi:hypothetical protein
MRVGQRGLKLAMLRILALLLLVLALAYPASRLGLFEWPRRYDPLAVPDLREVPGYFSNWQMKLIDLDQQNCATAFRLTGRTVSFVPVKGASTSCEVADAIDTRILATAKIRPEDMRCAIAARLYAWDRNSLQPTARRILKADVVEVLHFGSYNCRNKRGGSSLSEHATANAFDISGFRLSDGRLVSVKKTWGNKTPEDMFLHSIREGLCDWFNVTLSPDYNADHADHFHVDMGLWRSCS